MSAVIGRDVEIARVRRLMYADAGVERDATGLARAIDFTRRLAAESTDAVVRDAATVAALVAVSALRRCESRGSHQRTDFTHLERSQRHHSFVTLEDAKEADVLAAAGSR